MNRPLTEKYLKLSEEQTTKEKKDYYWNLAESIDEVYGIIERAKQLDDRNTILRFFDLLNRQANNNEEDKVLAGIRVIIGMNKSYDKRNNTEGL
ncbi:hypothetical protein LCGC14_3065900 [marine sediment metagenome]|uniref:Uncharacterized protein n=1 Tax=marine sediment metagenome TaxID=412755 RepID=A0A0F8WI50_9ZZZZ